MEIEVIPVTLEKRIEFLNQAAENREANKKSFPWMLVVFSLIAGAGICMTILFHQKIKKKESR